MAPASEMCEFTLDLILFLASFMRKKYQRRPGSFQSLEPFWLWFPCTCGCGWTFWQCCLAGALMGWACPSWKSTDLRCANGNHHWLLGSTVLGGVIWMGEISSVLSFVRRWTPASSVSPPNQNVRGFFKVQQQCILGFLWSWEYKWGNTPMGNS